MKFKINKDLKRIGWSYFGVLIGILISFYPQQVADFLHLNVSIFGYLGFMMFLGFIGIACYVIILDMRGKLEWKAKNKWELSWRT